MKSIANRTVRQFPARMPNLLLSILGLAMLPVSNAQDSQGARANAIHAMPLTFERYQDQFVSRTPGYTVFLEPRQVTIALRDRTDEARVRQLSIKNGAAIPTLSVRLLQSNPVSVGSPEDPLLAKSNYFIGNDPATWRTNVSLFSKVRFPSVYHNVDLVYYGNQQQLEYDFVIHPGGEPRAIRFSVDGASRASIAPSGDLILHSWGAHAILHRPVAYQIIDGERRNVSSSFLSLGRNQFGFRVAQYSHESPLIIDPVLAYSTYLGGSDDEGIFGIGFDDDGNIYVAGETSSLNFPQKGGVQNHVGGDYDVFVSKFDPRGDHLIYSTYLGGTKFDHAIGLRVDKHGSVYVAGITLSPDFPVRNAWQPALAGTVSGFVAKLSPSGTQLEFSTYLGGHGNDEILALTIDRANAVYVAGYTNSLDFPTTLNAVQRQCDRGAHQGFCLGDAFVTKFDPSGRSLVYSTYLGGAGFDIAAGLAVNEAGEIFVTGQTTSSDFPTRNPYQSSLRGPANVFIAALNEAGSDLKLSTYLGGSGFDGANDIVLDARGNIYVTGATSSTDFPVFHAFQSTNKGGISDGFVTKFNPQASELVYSTYYGGSGWDVPYRISVNRRGEAALIGFTSSTDFPTYRAVNPGYSGGATDAFVVLLDRDGQQPSFSTYLGGAGDEYGYAVNAGCHNSVWVGGSTSSTDFPLVRAFQPHYAGGPYDAFLSQIMIDDDSEESAASVLDPGEDRVKGCTTARE